MSTETNPHLAQARLVFTLEMAALEATRNALDESFPAVVEKMRETLRQKGKLLFSGVGKNEPICLKLVGTCNSTGAPSCFLNPTNALHGDLGLCAPGDLVFLFSNSGESAEIVALLPLLKRLEVATVAVTGRADSRLAKNCDHALVYRVEREACPLNLAPTASTTAALVLGDALAMALLASREFSREDFARFHPSGSLGQTLLLRVSDIMRSGERCAVRPDNISVHDAILAITKAKSGIVALTEGEGGPLSGVFTDGDFRRAVLKTPEALGLPVADFMTRRPTTIRPDLMAVEALKVFQNRNFNEIVVVDTAGLPLGVIDSQDLPKLKIL